MRTQDIALLISFKVQCPICNRWVKAATINAHIDANCPLPSTSNNFTNVQQKDTEQPEEPKNNSTIQQDTSQTSTRMAPLFVSKSRVQTSISSTESSSSSKRALEESPVFSKRKKPNPAMDAMPLAAKVRPSTLSEFVGQEELLGPHGVLRSLIDNDRIPSMVLWGPPGCGKTTIARIISKMTKSRFIELSATSHGAADVKKAFDEAKGHLFLTGQKTIIFIDEIHRFTKAQQDLFLPYVEHGTICLIGATTENPRVFVLQRLDQEKIEVILTRALQHWKGSEQLGEQEIEGIRQLAIYSDGDARHALNTLETALNLLPSKESQLTAETVKDQHYDIISALHKSIRGSDPNAALYWLGRMLEAGEDPLCASEDIGLADNSALPLAVAAYQACERIGMPECDTILAHLVVHLAETKKSVRTYKAYNLVKETIRQKPAYPVPLHIRNAPTKLMKDLNYGKGYKYNPDYDEPVDQTYLPEELKDIRFLKE
ncbi:P-loop containing nucleoside triphosphate hydrolase protein [Rhizopus microsporus ATCC 52813]|uniref:P-loop containing nucleoside triphosphate hydrolase protein n=1 Tax=Rhizopus microsporus ATCC 52813 TaxID=1340429 RepID=A0A2G4SKN2_RHIZD|nr:P-loop containing nucleoside triphosphate hydrolase protein [Rhizopus microsporus ATCC 52813]PHZ09325.1 P-loop containing nucleoside triphosphate hydrolase protein [Rhizopus microsporus ATCC 52813]